MNPLVQGLTDPARSGIVALAASELAALAAAADAAGLPMLRIDLRGCRDKPALLKRIARALGTPAAQGRNWDALADQLRDLGWLPESRGHILLFTHAGSLHANDPASFSTLLSLLADAADHWRTRGVPFQAVFILPAHALRVQGNSSEPR